MGQLEEGVIPMRPKRLFVAILAGGLAALLPSAALGAIKITKIRFDPPGADYTTASQLRAEYVVLKNTGSGARSLRGWKLRDRAGHVYSFGQFRLRAGRSVTIHTGSGNDDRNDVFWGSGNFIWNNDGDTATLKNRGGSVRDRCSYPGGESPNPPKLC